MKKEAKLEIKCLNCGKVTKHYLSKKGEVRCLICGTVNKVTSPKKNLEVVFEADDDFDKVLNGEQEGATSELG